MSKNSIKKIKAREILDSKGNPTVEVDLVTAQGLFQASVPSGVSKGKYEAVELRDGEERYHGKGVLKAVRNINEILAPELVGRDPSKQKEIDDLMIGLDATGDKSKLGANTVLAVSIAACRAGAAGENLPLWKHITHLSQRVSNLLILPVPCLLIIEGGLHAGNDLDVQEFMIAPSISSGQAPSTNSGQVPPADSFKEMLRMGTEIYHTLGSILEKEHGKGAINIGLEGGFAPPLKSTKEALDLIIKAIKEAGYFEKIKIILDVAATHFYKDNVYRFEGKAFTGENFFAFYSDMIEGYPILGLEDPFFEDDWESFKTITEKFGEKIFIIGDDLLVTNIEKVKKGIEEKVCNALILKPNQIGTVSETIKVANYAKKHNWETFVKHRSGETTDTFISDLAVGLGAKYIMAGAPTRGERVAKYNRLLRIGEELKS